MSQISIIVPVYNVEKYLHMCIESILAQSFSDFELILVDDGSTDNSGLICDNYSSKDNRVRSIHTKNEGAARARNIGIELASCPLISFIDSDDYIESNYLSVLYHEYTTKQQDLILSGFKRVYINNSIRPEKGISVSCDNPEDIGVSLFELDRHKLFNSQCCKLFKKQIIESNHLRFISGLSVSEDMIFSLSYLSHCNSLCSLNYEGYFYRQGRNSSLSKTIFPYCAYKQSIDTLYRLRQELIVLFHVKDDRYTQLVNQEFFDGTIWSLLSLSFLPYKTRIQDINILLKDYSDDRFSGIVTKSIYTKIVYNALKRKSVLWVLLLCYYSRIKHMIANLIRK